MLLVFVLLSAASGLVAAGFAAPFVGAAASVTRASQQLFDELPSDFNILEPSELSVIKASDGTDIAQFYALNRIVVPLDEISVNVQNAIIAVEDQRFYQHKGVDPNGIVRAFVSNAAGGSQGASTLTQQYVRNVLMEAGLQADDAEAVRAATERTSARKIREIKYALTLEQKYTKQQILEGYLNIAAFGPSTYGVEASSRYFFSHSAKDLTIPEAALLAGLTNAPSRYNPTTNPEEAKGRMDWVLQKMYEEEFITEEQYNEGLATQISDLLNITENVGGCEAAGGAAYFCRYVFSEIENSDLYGATPAERRQLLLRGGLTITTTLEPSKQAAAENAIASLVPVGDPSNVKTAIASVQPGTGRIVAMAQNTNYGNATAQDPTATQISFSADASHGGLENADGTSGFAPGSTFKPFVLAEWYEEGRSGYTTFNSAPTTFPASAWNISCAPQLADQWQVRNVDNALNGSHNVINATRLSVNVAYARMTAAMDICAITNLAAKMGLTTNDGSPLMPRPSIALGAQAVTPLQMAAANATFAAHGVYCKPIALESVTDTNGQSLPVPSADCSQVMRAEAADQVALTMQSVLTPSGSGSTGALAGGRPAAGKTGTTDENTNVWFTGYTPDLAAAVWIGHSEGYSTLNGQTIGGRYYREMYGSSLPAPLWKAYMDGALAGTAATPFNQVSLNGTLPAGQQAGSNQGQNGQNGQDAQQPQAESNQANNASDTEAVDDSEEEEEEE